MSSDDKTTAEQRFRQAFDRLKINKPKVSPPGTSVSQNNVAKEAGCDPTALKKARFPTLVREIKAYVEINNHPRSSKRKERLKQRDARAAFKQELADVVRQRDKAQSQLLSTQRRVVELTLELLAIKAQLNEQRPLPSVLCR